MFLKLMGIHLLMVMMSNTMLTQPRCVAETAHNMVVFRTKMKVDVQVMSDKQHIQGHQKRSDLKKLSFHGTKIKKIPIFASTIQQSIIMADGYLEKRYEEVFGTGAKKTVVKRMALETLMEKNRSYRGYDQSMVVKREMLERIVAVNTKIASAKNQQVLRFKLVTKDTGAEHIINNMKLGGLLPELHLPFPGTEPEAFIIICSTIPENKFVDIDLGISAQSMLLKATEMGLNGIMIGAFNKAKVTEAFNLPYEPLLILAIGKGKENIKLKTIGPDEGKAYYRDEKGVQFVPKLTLNCLLL